MRPGSELGRQVAVDFESNADFHEGGSCPVHSCLPTFHNDQQPCLMARRWGVVFVPCLVLAHGLFGSVRRTNWAGCVSGRLFSELTWRDWWAKMDTAGSVIPSYDHRPQKY